MKTNLLSLLLIFSVVLFSCKKDKIVPKVTPPPKPTTTKEVKNPFKGTVFENYESNKDYSSFLSLASKSEISPELLKLKNNYTLMLPDNKAVDAYLKDKKLALDKISKEQALAIIQYHIIPSKLDKDQFVAKYKYEAYKNTDGKFHYHSSYHQTMLSSSFGAKLSLFVFGEQKWTDKVKGKVFINSTFEQDKEIEKFFKGEPENKLPVIEVLDFDKTEVKANAAIVYKISNVLVPLNIRQFFVVDRINNSDMIKNYIGDEINKNLKGKKNITVFIPQRRSGDRYSILQLFKLVGSAKNIFQYLSLNQPLEFSKLGNSAVTNFNGEKLIFDTKKDEITDSNNLKTKVIIKDIVSTDGVCHYIDDILAPKGLGI